MLRTRILTAVVLVSIFLPALFCLPPSGWVAFVTLIAAVATWEWGGLMALNQFARIVLAGSFILLCIPVIVWQPAALGLEATSPVAAWLLGKWFYLPSAMFWLVVVPLWMRMRWVLPKGLAGIAAGLLLLFPTWLALIQLRQIGEMFLLAIMAAVWLADTAAYFSGRRFGRHKLAPLISPGKTWEGAIGGGLAVMAYGFVLATDYLPLSPPLQLGVMAALATISVIGDLFESLLKRQAGLKDSSNILPGHGGVLDRIDSLTSTLPMVALVWLSMLN